MLKPDDLIILEESEKKLNSNRLRAPQLQDKKILLNNKLVKLEEKLNTIWESIAKRNNISDDWVKFYEDQILELEPNIIKTLESIKFNEEEAKEIESENIILTNIKTVLKNKDDATLMSQNEYDVVARFLGGRKYKKSSRKLRRKGRKTKKTRKTAKKSIIKRKMRHNKSGSRTRRNRRHHLRRRWTAQPLFWPRYPGAPDIALCAPCPHARLSSATTLPTPGHRDESPYCESPHRCSGMWSSTLP